MLNVADIVSVQALKETKNTRLHEYETLALQVIETSFPAVVCTLSDSQRLAVVRTSYQNSKALGFVSSSDHLRYLSPVFFWGSFFISDPQMQSDLLAAGWEHGRTHRPSLTRLAHQLDLYADETAQDLISYARFMDALKDIFLQDWTYITVAEVAEACRRVWPHRAGRLGPDRLTAFVTEVGKTAHGLGLTQADLAAYCALALFFGHGMYQDPLYPWAIEAFTAMTPDNARSAEDRRKHLLAGVRMYFDVRNGLVAERLP